MHVQFKDDNTIVEKLGEGGGAVGACSGLRFGVA
jgi:hypothetical protein